MTDDLTEVPEFSGEDFSDDKDIQKKRAEAQAYKKLIEDSLAIVKTQLALEESTINDLEKFVMFGSLNATITDSFQSANFPSTLKVFAAEYARPYSARDPYSDGDLYLFGYFELSRNFPSTYICQESIREKIASLFLKNDTDFPENKKFSRKFNVVTQDGPRLADLVKFRSLDDLTAFPEMEIEIHGNTCLFRSTGRPVTPEAATQFSALAKLLSGILS